MIFLATVGFVIVGLIWFAFQDCDLNLRFWSLLGPREDVLSGKVAWITGAGNGIARALAIRWASKSVRLALNDLDLASLERVRDECVRAGASAADILLLPGDVTDASNHGKWMKAVLDHFGGDLDVLVNSAGRARQGLFGEVPLAVDRAILDVNLVAPIALAKLVVPFFVERRAGHIVQISSMLARLPTPFASSYGASKAAVLSYFTTLRAELWRYNVSVTTVCPGFTRTELMKNSGKTEGAHALVHDEFPRFLNCMEPSRLAELISIATINSMGEVLISTQPGLTVCYFNSLFPIFMNWLLAALVVPIMARLCFKEKDATLIGKVAWITGAGSGIGKAVALRWASKGVRLALNDLNPDSLEQVKKKCLELGASAQDILLLPGDITNHANHSEWMAAILESFGQLDILVNNAGRAIRGHFAEVPMAMDRSLFDLNVMAHVGLTKTVLPHLVQRRTGHIVQISSILSRVPSLETSAYAATKAAVLSYFTTLRTEVWKDNVAVTVVCPGPVQTNIMSSMTTVGASPIPVDQQGTVPKVLNPMGKRRAAELISLATVNRMGEVWVSTHPILLLAQLNAMFPALSAWFGAAVFFPVMTRLAQTAASGKKEA